MADEISKLRAQAAHSRRLAEEMGPESTRRVLEGIARECEDEADRLQLLMPAKPAEAA